MKFRNGVLVATAAVLLAQTLGGSQEEFTKANDATRLGSYESVISYQDVTSATPYVSQINALKELQLLDLGDNFYPTAMITYGHLAYVLGNSNFEFAKDAPKAQEVTEDFHVYQQSFDFLVEKGIFNKDMDLEANVTYEGLAAIVSNAFDVDASDLLREVSSETIDVKRADVARYLFEAFKTSNGGEKEIKAEYPVATVTEGLSNKVTASADVTATISDVSKTYWGHDAIMSAVQKGYVNGYSDGTFRPEQEVSNAEFMKMLTVGLGTSVTPVTGNDWYKPYLEAAKQQGYLNNGDIAGIKWTNQMSRTDVVNMSLAFLGKKPANPKKSWYEATKLGLINGVDNKGTLWETKTLTRAQAVTIIERVIKVKNGETLPVDKNAKSVAEVLYHRTNLFTMFPNHLKESDVDEIQEHMFIQTYGGGAYKGETTGVYIIDLSDPNDPYRHLLKGAEMLGQPFNKTSGFVVLRKGTGTVTSNPLNLPIFSPGSASATLNKKGGTPIYYSSVRNVIQLSWENKTSGKSEFIGGSYYSPEKIQNLDLIEFSVTHTMDFGGGITIFYQKVF